MREKSLYIHEVGDETLTTMLTTTTPGVKITLELFGLPGLSVNIRRSVLKRPALNPLSVVSEISDTGNSFWLSGEINSDKSEGRRATLGGASRLG